jgi:hypothetical protein
MMGETGGDMPHESQTDTIQPDRLTVTVGSLEVTATTHKDACVKVDGKAVPARRIVVTLEAGKPPVAVLEWYPSMEFVTDGGGLTWVVPKAAADASRRVVTVAECPADLPVTVHYTRPPREARE